MSKHVKVHKQKRDRFSAERTLGKQKESFFYDFFFKQCRLRMSFVRISVFRDAA